MSEKAIIIEGIGKRYQLAKNRGQRPDSLAELLAGSAKSLFSKGDTASRKAQEFWALKDVSFAVQKGDRVGIIGRNGAGKSTLLKILSRIVKPTTGKIEFYGRMTSLLEVGTGFHGDLTGRENIYLNGSLLGMNKEEIDAKFDEIVAFSEVEKFLDTPVKRYSSGMYVRLAFSVAAHLDNEILIVDEVLAVGDAAFQEKCIGKINATQSEGKTVLFVSHNIGQISALCNKGIFLEEGRVTYNGGVEQAVGLYLNKNKAQNPVSVVFSEKSADYWLMGVELADAAQQAGNVFKHNEGYFVKVKIKCLRRIEDVVLSILVNDGFGRRIVSMNLPVSDKIAPGDEKVFTAAIPGHYLMPNEYTVSVGLHIPNIQLFDEESNAIAFKIVDNGSEFYKYSGELGFIFPKNEWLY